MDAPADCSRNWTRDLARLALLVLVAVGLRVWVIARSEVAARDSIGFIRLALHLEQPPADYEHPGRTLTRLDVVRRSEHPPGYAVAVWAASVPVRELTGGTMTDPDTMVLTCQIVSAIAGVLMIFPMYYLGRTVLGGRDLAFAAALLFQTLPVFVEVTSDGLSDGLYLLCIATTLWGAAHAFRSPAWWKFVAVGLGAGVTYLVRPEGLMVALAVGVLIALLKMRSLWTWRMTCARSAALGLGVLLVFVPYVGATGKITNKPTGNQFLKWLTGGEVAPVWKGQTAAPSSAMFASWYGGEQPKAMWAIQAFAKEATKTGHYGVPFLGLLGLVLLARKMWADPALMLLAVLGAVNTAIILAVAVMIGYVSERHTLLVVMLGCYFAAGALPTLGRWLASVALVRHGNTEFWAKVALVVLAVGGLPVLAKPMHTNRAGHHAAGLYLAEHAEANALILDPFCWSEFYAGRAWGYEPPRPLHHIGPLYVVVEPTNINPHSRLPLIEMTRQMMQVGTPVFTWPESKSPAQASVVVYRLVVEK